MATLQKIRSYGKILIGVVGLALFAFIAEELVRAFSYTRTESHQRIGEIYGENINVQDFNNLVEEYSSVIKFTNGLSSLTEEQTASIRDQVWQTYVNQKLIEHECEKLGLTVTDAEMQNIITTGRNPMLAQTPFRTQQGGFDVNALKNFLNQYEEIRNNNEISGDIKEQYTQMYNYWQFVEKSIRQQTLAQKYQTLLAATLVSNPVAAQYAFDGKTNESEVLMAALPYTTVKDADVTVEDNELKAKYNEMKEIFRTSQETRNIRYIDVEVTASQEDKDALQQEMNQYAASLAEGAEPAKVVREAGSSVAYSQLPISAKTLPHDIAERIDSMQVGTQIGPFIHAHDNTTNIVRLIGKVSSPDSVEIRQIVAPGTDMASAEKTADSIMTALAGGENFDSIAKKYNQPATKTWVTSEQYEGMTIDENNRKFIQTITTASVGSYNKIVMDGQGVMVAQVTDRRNLITKYDVAVIKRTIDFSKDTYSKAYNKFSSFLAGNATAADIEANAAKEGYNIQTRKGMGSSEHYVAGVRSTRDAMRWIFDGDTKPGAVSPLYECGDNDHLLVVILDGVNPKGYANMDDDQVKSFLTTEVQKDKKAAILLEKMEAAKSIEDVAKMEGAVTDTIKHINFASNAFISKVGASEPALSGSVSSAKQGDFKAGIKGNSAVYAYKVLAQDKTAGEFDKKKEERTAAQMMLRSLGNFTSELYDKADVVDHRYLFY